MQMKRFTKKLIIAISVAFILFLPVISFADGTQPIDASISPKIVNPIGIDDVNGLIKTILEGVITIGIPVIALAIIYCGFLFVQARGKPESIKKAKDALIYTLIGAALLLGAWAIAQMISDTVLAL
jgi:hypothetical protein